MPLVNTWGLVDSWESAATLTITAVSSARGADIATADGQITITVSDSTGINSVTVAGVALANVAIVDATTVTADCPHGFGVDYGTQQTLTVSDGTNSASYTVTVQPRAGTVRTAFTVDYAGLSADSPFAGDAQFSSLVAGDSCIHDAVTAPDGIGVTMSGDGVFTLASQPTQDQTIGYSIFDASDLTDGPIGSITVQAVLYVDLPTAYETDSAGDLQAQLAVVLSTATETDTAGDMLNASPLVIMLPTAYETDAAAAMADGSAIVVELPTAYEADTAGDMIDMTPQVITLPTAYEVDAASAMIDASPVVGTIDTAYEADTAGDLAAEIHAALGTAVEVDAAGDMLPGDFVLPRSLTMSTAPVYLTME